MQNEHIFDSL